MDLEGKYFVFDYACSWDEDVGFAIMQVNKGKLEERYHPAPDGEYLYLSDIEAINYLKKNNIMDVLTIDHNIPEHPNKFLNYTLWHREELVDDDLLPGQFSYFQYLGVSGRKNILTKEGIEVIVMNPTPYITREKIIKPVEEDLQLSFNFLKEK
jgi:hypothetical protein